MDDSVKYSQQEDSNKLDKIDKDGNKIIEITPLKKSKRALLFLCDFFIMFFGVFFLFNACVFPLAKVIGGYGEKIAEKEVCEKGKLDILYENDLLLYDTESKYKFETNLTFTFSKFLYNWTYDKNNSEKFDIISNYYIGVKGDQTAYNNAYFNNDDPEHNFFNYDKNHKPISLKDEFKSEFMAYFDTKSEMSKEGKKMFNKFQNNFFTKAYSDVIYEIKQIDLKGENNTSFINFDKRVNEITKFQNVTYISSTIISYFLGWLVFYLIIPLCNKHGKTLSMMILQVERIGTNNLYLLKKGETLIASVYYLASNLAFVMFVPLTVVSLNYLFALTPLVLISIISLCYVLVSTIVMLFNSFNKTLTDILTQSVMITSEDLNQIYREKGYKI